MTLKIYGLVKSNILLQDQLDQILLEVEQVLNKKENKKILNTTYNTIQQEVNYNIDSELEEDVGVIEIIYNVYYRCYENNTEVTI